MSDQQISMFANDKDAGGKDTQAAPGKTISFTLSRTLHSDAQTAIDQWLIPVFIGEWMFGEHVGDDEILELSNTVRKGGDFSYSTRRDGKKITHQGSYLELHIPRRLVCSWQQSDYPDSEVQVSAVFEPLEDKTRLKLQITLPETLQAARDTIKAQWAARCDALVERPKLS